MQPSRLDTGGMGMEQRLQALDAGQRGGSMDTADCRMPQQRNDCSGMVPRTEFFGKNILLLAALCQRLHNGYTFRALFTTSGEASDTAGVFFAMLLIVKA